MTPITQADTATRLALAEARNRDQTLMGDTQDRFLTLLVTQLQNQDPLNPLDNAQVTSQIAQLSTVNGINQLNATLLALSGQMDMSQSMQAASLIGKGVLLPGNKVSLGGEGNLRQATPMGVEVISPAASVAVDILDAAGRVVRSLDLGAQPAGVVSLVWDGLDDSGQALRGGAYMARAQGVGEHGGAVPVDMLTYGVVASVAPSSSGPQLDMGLAGRHGLRDVKKIL